MLMRTWNSCILSLLVLLLLANSLYAQQLTENFYSKSCPNAESIITSTMTRLCKDNNVVPIATLRLFAHDCFVDGCDGSILISSTSTNVAERDAEDNKDFPQNPFDAINTVKQTVEQACPGVVSCADVLAMATRDAVVFSGGPDYTVLKGRRDGLISQASSVGSRLPGANMDTSQLITNFAAVGLTPFEMVVLSGAHTIGFSHCHQFTNRLYGASGPDPRLSSSFAKTLQDQCPRSGGDPGTVQAFDISTPFTFDNAYYRNLLQNAGLLVSDSTLTSDNTTLPIVTKFAEDQQAFFDAFAAAMTKLGTVGVKTGKEGEIRRDCTKFNNS